MPGRKVAHLADRAAYTAAATRDNRGFSVAAILQVSFLVKQRLDCRCSRCVGRRRFANNVLRREGGGQKDEPRGCRNGAPGLADAQMRQPGQDQVIQDAGDRKSVV